MKLQASVLHRQSRDLLQKVENPKKLVLIHTVVSVGSSLLVTALNYLLSLSIEDTGGLSGMDLRTILETVQSVLELVVMFALPFWEIGLIYVGLRWIKGEKATASTLLQGFRRFAPVLRFRVLYSLIFIIVSIGLLNICSTMYMLTPFGKSLADQLIPLMDPALTTQQLREMLTPELMGAIMKEMIPLFILFAVVFIPVALGIFYRLRLAEYGVMDDLGVRKSMGISIRATRKNTWQLIKIDLHFWWFYLLQGLCVALCYGDQILQLAGISLPVSPAAVFFLFYTAGMVLQGILVWQCQDQLLGTYCLVYREMAGEPVAPQDAAQQ